MSQRSTESDLALWANPTLIQRSFASQRSTESDPHGVTLYGLAVEGTLAQQGLATLWTFWDKRGRRSREK